ncbi:hypothetical protein [Streptomyces sp. NPDC048669]|uniref:hypothetical protein n=1 Tax=Streptomyces sp. NPDC048669 TaxID=3155267 RepID=UPI0034189E1D
MITLATLAALVAGYGLGRYRPAHRTSDWANWQRYGKRPSGARYWATFIVLSAENIGWLITHPVKGWAAWQHRNDPPPPLSPPVRIRETTATEEPTR